MSESKAFIFKIPCTVTFKVVGSQVESQLMAQLFVSKYPNIFAILNEESLPSSDLLISFNAESIPTRLEV